MAFWWRFSTAQTPLSLKGHVNIKTLNKDRLCADTTGTVPLVWLFPIPKILIYFSNKIYGSNFIKQHSETVMVRNYQNADCILRKKFIVSFVIFGTLSFPISTTV